jgi:predicted ArsR family transcriptional regulator
MTIDLVLKFLKDPEREYDASEVAECLRLHEDAVRSHLRSLWKGGILERRKDNNRGRLVYRTKQAQLQLSSWPAGGLRSTPLEDDPPGECKIMRVK